MNTFGRILKNYRERAGLSQHELAAQAGLSTSTISRVETGDRSPPRRRSQVLAMAKAMGLSQSETDILLSASGFAPSTAPELTLHPRDDTLYKIAQELEALRTSPSVTPAQIRFVEETLLLILRGARAALPQADLAALPSGAPSIRRLGEEERYLDDLLGDLLSGKARGEAMPFAVLHATARSPHWELKRRLAEALPALLELDTARTLPLFNTLRDDPPDPEWRTDIRRRVIEAVPALWARAPRQVPPVLRWRQGDEVYAVLATLDVLADIGDKELEDEIRKEMLDNVPGQDRRAVTLYARALGQCATSPAAALQLIEQHRQDEERLVRICMARLLYRLLPTRPAETLKLMRHILRKENGKPVEHQNVRRAITRHIGALIALLDGPYDESVLQLVHTMIADPDIHTRRAVCDALPGLVEEFPNTALDLVEEYLLQDKDRFIHERTWNALRTLMNRGSERAEELCVRLIEIA